MAEIHHAEAFIDDAGRFGWQCLLPSCGRETVGYSRMAAAEIAAEAHEEHNNPGGLTHEQPRQN